MASVISLLRRNWLTFYPPEPPKSENALRFGILGAASIGHNALILPARSHPEVIIQAVAARDPTRAAAYAKKHGIPQVLTTYDDLINDPNIDVVYVPLPNGLHFEWALKALAKGKHVLLEKPAVSNAAEAERLFRSPLLQGLHAPVLLEAFHYRFQPGWQFFLTLVDPPNVEHASSVTKVPAAMFPADDIRFRFELGGGTMMDLGTYQMSALRQVFAAEPAECTACTARACAPPHELCDAAAEATFRFPNGGTGVAVCDLQTGLLGMTLPRVTVRHSAVAVADAALPEGQEKVRVRTVVFVVFMMASAWHRIDIEDEFTVRKTGDGTVVKKWSTRESKKIYTFADAGVNQPGEAYWMSYRHQLEQFVNRVRGREGSGVWVDAEDSIGQSRMIDMAYAKSDLPLRPTSKFELQPTA